MAEWLDVFRPLRQSAGSILWNNLPPDQWRRNEFKSGALKKFVVPFHYFGSTSTISGFGERFCDGQYTVWSVSCLLFFYSWCFPLVPSHL